MRKGARSELAEVYLKRISPYAKIEIQSLKEEKFRSVSDANRVKRIEAERIQKALIPNAFHLLLTEHGDEYSTTEFANKIAVWSEHETRQLQFVIGGPLGLDAELHKDFNATLALSKMTFPHELAQVLLLEQLYRAFTIQKGKTYHY